MSAPDGEGGAGVRDLLTDPKVVVDAVAPTVLFTVAATQADLAVAAAVALAWCGAVLTWRLVRRQGLVHAASGLGGVGVGVLVALLSGEAEGFFLPGIIGNLGFGALCAVSALARRPAVAYSSAALYRWPLGWYLHPRVRPAYIEITWLWAVYYLAKGGWQAALVASADLAALATVRVALGWPGLVVLLVATYAYVERRLAHLGGPSVQEWRTAHEPGGHDDGAAREDGAVT